MNFKKENLKILFLLKYFNYYIHLILKYKNINLL